MRTYDFAMTHKLDADDFFIHCVQQHCAEKGLNFFLIEPLWADAFLEKMEKGKVAARVLLNMHSEHHQPEDVFHQIVQLAFERQTQVIDPPDLAMAAFDKALLHPRLAAAGFDLPFSLIIPREKLAILKLDEEDRTRLGTPFVIKPSRGYGKRGVILDAQSEADIARSAALWPDSHYLLQKRIVPQMVDGAPAYFRVFYAFGSLWFCWWNCYTDRYSRLTQEEMEKFKLEPLRGILCRLAQLTQMRFFSSEIARIETGEFVLIDYINDQCHMLTQSSNPSIGVPDEIVAGIARCLVQGALPWLAK